MYEDKYNSNQLFLNEKFGLQRVYETLAKNNINGLSLDDFKNENHLSVDNISFAELLKTNFTNLDADKNQVISEQEINTFLNSIEKQGLTRDQLKALSVQDAFSTGDSKSLLSTVIENFAKIDTDHDGHVSQDEINAYKLNKEIEDKKAELYDFKTSNISLFYSDSSTNSTDSADEAANVNENQTTTSDS
jgi:hypothetical protein